MNRIKVMMVEDDLGWIKAMTSFLNMSEDIIVAGTATGKTDAVELAKVVQPDIILMDINLSGNKRDGIYAAIEIIEFSSAKIIMLTSMMDEEIIRDSFSARAVNYISKENYIELPNIIRDTYNKKSPVEVLAKAYLNLKKENKLKDLTPTEKEVFKLIEAGYSCSHIEEQLAKSHNTLKTQIKNILKKLNAKNTKEAVKKVSNTGFID